MCLPRLDTSLEIKQAFILTFYCQFNKVPSGVFTFFEYGISKQAYIVATASSSLSLLTIYSLYIQHFFASQIYPSGLRDNSFEYEPRSNCGSQGMISFTALVP